MDCRKRGQKSVLFVCLGNICRSSMAEAVFKHLVREKGCADEWLVDSAGTGSWNLGELPDPRGLRVLSRRGGLVSTHRSRLVKEEDFKMFQHILCMDNNNQRDLLRFAPATGSDAGPVSKPKVRLLGSFDGSGEIPDPYYGVEKDFDITYDRVKKACEQFLNEVST